LLTLFPICSTARWEFAYLTDTIQGIKIRNVLVAGPGFSELLKPDIVVPLLENLQLEERLAPYLPEVFVTLFCISCFFTLSPALLSGYRSSHL
jgi:hypothetical protein